MRETSPSADMCARHTALSSEGFNGYCSLPCQFQPKCLLSRVTSHKEYNYLKGSSNGFFCGLNERTLFFWDVSILIFSPWHFEGWSLIFDIWRLWKGETAVGQCPIASQAPSFLSFYEDNELSLTSCCQREHHVVIFSYCYLRYIWIIE